MFRKEVQDLHPFSVYILQESLLKGLPMELSCKVSPGRMGPGKENPQEYMKQEPPSRRSPNDKGVFDGLRNRDASHHKEISGYYRQ